MKNQLNEIGLKRQAILEAAKVEKEQAEKNLVEYQKMQGDIDSKLESGDLTEEEYNKLSLQQKDLQIKIALTIETIAEYQSFLN